VHVCTRIFLEGFHIHQHLVNVMSRAHLPLLTQQPMRKLSTLRIIQH
jgi:hypothetical protein